MEKLQLIFAIIFLAAGLTGLLVTYLTREWAIRHKIGEEPHPRKMHKRFMPHMGGFGIYAGFISGIGLCALFLPQVFTSILERFGGILAASLFIVMVGVYDDLKGLDATKKFIGQFLAATIIVAFGYTIRRVSLPFTTDIELGIFAIPVTYLWLIGVSNAVNLLDGLDGLAAGVSLIASTVFAILAYQNQNWAFLVVSLSLMGGLIGFLRFNYHPASIFMGDTGSLFLGLMLAALGMRGFETAPGRVGLLLPILILAIPIGDTTVAFFRRLNKGKHPFKPDKDHLHHRLIYLGLSHRQAVYLIYLSALSFGITAYLLARHFMVVGGILLGVVLLLAIFGLKRLGYLEAQRIKTYYGDHEIIKSQPILAPLSIRRVLHKMLLVATDVFTVNLSLFVTWWIRYASGWFDGGRLMDSSIIFDPVVMVIFTLSWLFLFFMNNLYNLRWDVSRFDHIRRVSKVILFGVLVLFLITFNPSQPFSEGRLSLMIYALVLLICVNGGRLLLIFVEKKLQALEYAPHKTILIGDTNKARRLMKDIRNNPHLLYDVVGYVTKEPRNRPFANLPFLGTYDDLPKIVREQKVEEVIIAINERSRDEILNLVARIDNPSVIFKIIPQMYDAISGLKTEEVLGHPLMRLFPEPMNLWQWGVKRLLDVVFSALLLVLLSPLFLLIAILQALNGIFPPFVAEQVVGKHGKPFGMFNFRTKAKNETDRPLIGRLLFNTRIYKLPALLNILMGKMSFVGPRPERVEEVERLRQKIKFYNRRFQVRPGLTGWAQVKYRYEEALKFKRDQLKQDLFYLENMSLAFDMRILMRSIFIFLGKTGTR